MNYEDDMRISESDLDLEWLDQASLAMRYGRLWADAKKDVALAEEQIKIIRSELIHEANDDPVGTCGKDKPNAADIEAYYRNHRKHKKAKEDFIQAQYELDLLEVAKNEICFTRKMALENLVILHGQQYFAGPKVPRDLTLEAQKRAKQKNSNRGVGEKMKRTRTRQN
jgi:hypothetical protein